MGRAIAGRLPAQYFVLAPQRLQQAHVILLLQMVA